MSWALFAVIRNKCVYAAFHLQHCICHQHQYWSRIGKTLPDAKRTSSKFKSVLLDVEFNRCLVDFIKRGTRFSGLILLNTTVVHFCWSSNIQSKRPIGVLSVSVCYVFHPLPYLCKRYEVVVFSSTCPSNALNHRLYYTYWLIMSSIC